MHQRNKADGKGEVEHRDHIFSTSHELETECARVKYLLSS